jgi:hypothetical protein
MALKNGTNTAAPIIFKAAVASKAIIIHLTIMCFVLV